MSQSRPGEGGLLELTPSEKYQSQSLRQDEEEDSSEDRLGKEVTVAGNVL